MPVGLTGSVLREKGRRKDMSGSGELPFTGSIFTLPLLVLGLTLTLAGWVVRRLGRENA